MDIVYKMINQTRLVKNTPPYYYIGSKNNCVFIDNVIIDKFGKRYKSSTKSVILKEHLKTDEFYFIVLFEKDKDDKNDITFYERNEQLKISKESWDSEYYNKAYAISGFTTNGFANYHYGDNKIISLPVKHPDVLSGKAIAQQKNRIISEEERVKLRNRVHPSEKMDWSKKLKGCRKKSNFNYKKSKSEEHRKNIANAKKKPIEMLDKNFTHIAFFESIYDASKENKFNRNTISLCCNNKQKFCCGYVWRFI